MNGHDSPYLPKCKFGLSKLWKIGFVWMLSTCPLNVRGGGIWTSFKLKIPSIQYFVGSFQRKKKGNIFWLNLPQDVSQLLIALVSLRGSLQVRVGRSGQTQIRSRGVVVVPPATNELSAQYRGTDRVTSNCWQTPSYFRPFLPVCKKLTCHCLPIGFCRRMLPAVILWFLPVTSSEFRSFPVRSTATSRWPASTVAPTPARSVPNHSPHPTRHLLGFSGLLNLQRFRARTQDQISEIWFHKKVWSTILCKKFGAKSWFPQNFLLIVWLMFFWSQIFLIARYTRQFSPCKGDITQDNSHHVKATFMTWWSIKFETFVCLCVQRDKIFNGLIAFILQMANVRLPSSNARRLHTRTHTHTHTHTHTRTSPKKGEGKLSTLCWRRWCWNRKTFSQKILSANLKCVLTTLQMCRLLESFERLPFVALWRG